MRSDISIKNASRFVWAGMCLALAAAARAEAPYPLSPVISGVNFDFATRERQAPGSDNWAITRADDDHQYAAWGDGGGFGGTNSDGRVSLGVARIEGSNGNYQGFNVWGGGDRGAQARFGCPENGTGSDQDDRCLSHFRGFRVMPSIMTD